MENAASSAWCSRPWPAGRVILSNWILLRLSVSSQTLSTTEFQTSGSEVVFQSHNTIHSILIPSFSLKHE